MAARHPPFSWPGALVLGVLWVAVLVPGMAHGEALGRLFFTPEQRAALDEERFAPPPEQAPEPEVAEEQPPPEPPPPLRSLRMEGLVVRSHGPNTAWVDGRPVLRKGTTDEGVTVDPTSTRDGGVAVRVRGSDTTVDLKPGQRFDPASARVSELTPGPSETAPGLAPQGRAGDAGP
ncbi:MAG: hypothetical protein U5S82_09110 [Gammaproteobacteria bacterium]|nr:hypothetical protein [Gammaproteobacteria bacterium]